MLEGIRLVEEAFHSTLNVVAVCSSDASWLGDVQVPKVCQRYAVTPEIVAKCVTSETPQPTFAVAELPAVGTDFDWQTIEIALLLDAIQDPGNMGAILRTAAAAGVDVVVMGDGCVDLFARRCCGPRWGPRFAFPRFVTIWRPPCPRLKSAGCQVLASIMDETAIPLFSIEAACEEGRVDRGQRGERHSRLAVIGSRCASHHPDVPENRVAKRCAGDGDFAIRDGSAEEIPVEVRVRREATFSAGSRCGFCFAFKSGGSQPQDDQFLTPTRCPFSRNPGGMRGRAALRTTYRHPRPIPCDVTRTALPR